MVLPVGSAVNALAIAAGAILGMKLGSRLSEGVRGIVFQGLGLCVLVIGLQMALVTKEPLLVVFSVVPGGIIGEMLRLEERFLAAGDRVKARLGSANPRFTEGLVTGSVLFCIGAMAIIGSFDEGLRGDRTVIYSKSVMDGFAALALGSAFGLGVAFSAVPILVYQGALTLAASQLKPWLGPELMNELTAVGGVLVIGIALNLLDLCKIRLSNFLPALPLIVLLSLIFLP